MKLFTTHKSTPRSGEDKDSVDFKRIKESFVSLNSKRLQRLYQDMRRGEKDFVDVLLLLFHVNHPLLPGYVSKNTPSGIPEYMPAKSELAIARKISKSFEYKKRAYRKFDIHGIYLMGSTGTIAFGEHSDLDVWVVHDSKLDLEQLDELRNKTRLIEKWAQDNRVDANIFLVDPEKFRKGEHGTLSTESSGSALHVLLLEEFYRTSVLLGGYFPAWWLVPPGEEKNYQAYVEDLNNKRFPFARGVIDFGGLGHISPGEFYGATLWLLYKGINSPYKSIIKILLMESYASEYPDIDLLGLRFKKSIYKGNSDINDLDPYLMMLQKVEEYLLARGQRDRLELVRNSFYMKVDEKLSQPDGDKPDWRRELLGSYVNKWGWPHTRMLMLDSRESWKIKRVSEERKALINEFMNSYRFITEFARNEQDNSLYISKTDLNILGRKLFAAFERKAGKVEIVYRGITPDMFESHISIHQVESDNNDYWMVFSGLVTENDIQISAPLHRTYSLMEMLTWCFFNKIINRKTVIALYTHDSDLSDKELELIIDILEKLFPDEVMESSSYDFRQAARIKAVGTLVNVGLDPFSSYTRQGNHLASGRSDALRYGGRSENLALSLEQIIITSWQEVLTFRYVGIEGLFSCLHDYMQWSPPSSGKRPPSIEAHSFSSYRGTSIANRVSNLFETVIRCFYSGEYPEGTRYVLGVEWDYYILWMEGDTLHYQSPGSIDGLYDYLSQPQDNFTQILFDPETLSDTVLPRLYAMNQPGIVQCFFEIRNADVTTYVLDEKGSLSRQTKPFYDMGSLLVQYRDFLRSVHERMSLLSQNSIGQPSMVEDVYYYKVERFSDGHCEINKHSINPLMRSDTGIKLQVLSERVDNKTMFSVYCNDNAFSSIEYGKDLFNEVAKYIVSLRQGQNHYPIYVTDVDVSLSLLRTEQNRVQTSHYLNYKYRVEEYLNKALAVTRS